MAKSMKEDARLVLGGDPLAMRSAQGPGPSLFARCLSLMVPLNDSVESRDPVVAAAVALSLELTGDREGALTVYSRLARHRDPYVALLGQFLLVWSGVDGDELDVLVRRVMRLPTTTTEERRFRSINLLRALSMAADGGHREAAEAIWQVAKAEVRGELAHGVALVGQRWFGAPQEWSFKRRSRRELLVPWVYEAIQSDQASLLEDQFLAGSRSIWSFGWRLERFPGGDAVSGELQAIWAGALWALPDARRAQAIHLWNRHQKTHASTVAANWLLGSGKEQRRVLDWLEPAFDRDSASQVAASVGDGARVPNLSDWYAFLVALWDELPEEYVLTTARTLLGQVVDETVQLPGEEAARFIANAARRLGPRLRPYLTALPASVAPSIAHEIHATWAGELDDAVRSWARGVLEGEAPTQNDRGESALLLASLGTEFSTLADLGEPLSPLVVANLLSFIDVPDEAVLESLSAATNSAVDWLDQIGKGTYGMGISHSFVLARLVDAAAAGPARASGIAALARIVAEPTVPTRERLEALTYLAEVRSANIEALPRPQSGDDQQWLETGPSPAALPVAWLGLRPVGVDWGSAGMDLLAASRDSDPVVRSTASRSTAACADLLEPEAINGVLLGALYDDQLDVLRPLLSPRVTACASASTRRLLWRRLPARVATESRGLRAAVARYVVVLPVEDTDANDLRQILRNDRSWYIRKIMDMSPADPDQ